jgi:hypothetical protein
MYRAIFQEYGESNLRRRKYVEEEVWGYFESPEHFKKEVLKRFTSKRDEPVFTEDNEATIVVRWRYVDSLSRSCLRLMKINSTGWLTGEWPYGAPSV